MGQGYLIDSNAIIDFFNSALPEKGIALFLNIEPAISIITQIELFSKRGLLETEINNLKEFIDISSVYDVDKNIAVKTIDFRLLHNIKLADAIIAATAFEKNLILITRNTSDFIKIKGLEIINPHSL